MPESWVRSLGWEDPLEKKRATKESDMTERLSTFSVPLIFLSLYYQLLSFKCTFCK